MATALSIREVPLAIELAAARVRALPIEEINTRLDNRFRLLTGGSRTALPRQQTLHALIDWSYDLLQEQEKRLLCCLSVFAGGWTLEAAEAVCAGADIEDWEVLDLLTSLVDKSLVVFEEREAQVRYRLLETVRQYAQDRLRESQEGDAVLSRHREHFLVLSEMAEEQLLGPAQVEWMQRLEAEHENLRAALDGSIQEMQQGIQSEEALRFCGTLSRFWMIRGYFAEGRQWCERTLAMQSAIQTDTPLSLEQSLEQRHGRAKTLHGVGTLALRQGDYASSRAETVTLGDKFVGLTKHLFLPKLSCLTRK